MRELTVGKVLNDTPCVEVPFTPGTFRAYRQCGSNPGAVSALLRARYGVPVLKHSKGMTVLSAAREAGSMGHRERQPDTRELKTIVRLPDLEQSENAVFNSLTAASSTGVLFFVIDSFSNKRT